VPSSCGTCHPGRRLRAPYPAAPCWDW
jgi:hypothetical protein